MLITLIILIVIGVAVFYFVDHMGIPNPWNWVVKLVVGLIILMKLLELLPGGSPLI